MNLLRLYLRYSAILFILLALILFGIHTQPFNDGGMHDILFAESCSTACLVGIQPGITTVAEAHDLLDKSGLVAQWIEPADDPVSGQLQWRWSVKHPAMFVNTDASLTYDRKTGIVISFEPMATRVTFGTVLIMLGQPDMGFMSGGYNDRGGSIFTHAAGYSAIQLSMISTIQCPMTIRQLWDSTVTLQIAPSADQTARFTRYPARIQPFLAYAAYTFC